MIKYDILSYMINDVIYYSSFEDGGCYSVETAEGYELWEVPQYGGEPQYVDIFDTESEAKEFSKKLT